MHSRSTYPFPRQRTAREVEKIGEEMALERQLSQQQKTAAKAQRARIESRKIQTILQSKQNRELQQQQQKEDEQQQEEAAEPARVGPATRATPTAAPMSSAAPTSRAKGGHRNLCLVASEPLRTVCQQASIVTQGARALSSIQLGWKQSHHFIQQTPALSSWAH